MFSSGYMLTPLLKTTDVDVHADHDLVNQMAPELRVGPTAEPVFRLCPGIWMPLAYLRLYVGFLDCMAQHGTQRCMTYPATYAQAVAVFTNTNIGTQMWLDLRTPRSRAANACKPCVESELACFGPP